MKNNFFPFLKGIFLFLIFLKNKYNSTMKIIRQTRKTLSLSFDKNAELIVKVPKNISNKNINEFLEKHKKWILEKKNLLEKNNQKF